MLRLVALSTQPVVPGLRPFVAARAVEHMHLHNAHAFVLMPSMCWGSRRMHVAGDAMGTVMALRFLLSILADTNERLVIVKIELPHMLWIKH